MQNPTASFGFLETFWRGKISIKLQKITSCRLFVNFLHTAPLMTTTDNTAMATEGKVKFAAILREILT